MLGGDAALGSIVEDFARGGGHRNVRSRTSVYEYRGRQIHLKTSETNLAGEASTLERLAEGATGPVRALPFVAYNRNHNVLITERVLGDSLFNVLWNNTSPLTMPHREGQRCRMMVIGLGAWVRQFHTSSRDDTADPQACLEWIRQTASRKLSSIEQCETSILSSTDLERVRRSIDRRTRDVDTRECPVTRIHGDLCHANVLVETGGRLVVLDFADTREGFALEDIVRLWCSVWELSECGRRRHRMFTPVLPQLLEACGASADVSRTPMFTLLRQWNAITRILQHASTAARLPLLARRRLARLTRVHSNWLLTAS